MGREGESNRDEGGGVYGLRGKMEMLEMFYFGAAMHLCFLSTVTVTQQQLLHAGMMQ